MSKKRIKWSPFMIRKMTEFYHRHVVEGKTLDWCHTNFRSGSDQKYTSRYHSNKGAYNKYVRPAKPVMDRIFNNNAQGIGAFAKVKANSTPTITLSQILEYKKMAEAAGYQFILS